MLVPFLFSCSSWYFVYLPFIVETFSYFGNRNLEIKEPATRIQVVSWTQKQAQWKTRVMEIGLWLEDADANIGSR